MEWTWCHVAQYVSRETVSHLGGNLVYGSCSLPGTCPQVGVSGDAWWSDWKGKTWSELDNGLTVRQKKWRFMGWNWVRIEVMWFKFLLWLWIWFGVSSDDEHVTSNSALKIDPFFWQVMVRTQSARCVVVLGGLFVPSAPWNADVYHPSRNSCIFACGRALVTGYDSGDMTIWYHMTIQVWNSTIQVSNSARLPDRPDFLSTLFHRANGCSDVVHSSVCP